MRIMKITWRDSHRYTYQMEPHEEVTVTTIESVGFLVREQKDSYVLSQDDIMGDIRGVIVIPKENIINKKFI